MEGQSSGGHELQQQQEAEEGQQQEDEDEVDEGERGCWGCLRRRLLVAMAEHWIIHSLTPSCHDDQEGGRQAGRRLVTWLCPSSPAADVGDGVAERDLENSERDIESELLEQLQDLHRQLAEVRRRRQRHTPQRQTARPILHQAGRQAGGLSQQRSMANTRWGTGWLAG